MKKLVPFLILFAFLSCNSRDTKQEKVNAIQPPTVSRDSTEKIIERQQALLNKVYEMQEKNRDTTKQFIYFTCTYMDKSNQYVDLLSTIYKINKGDKIKTEGIRTCLIDIIKEYYFPNSDIIPLLHEFSTFRDANEDRSQYIYSKEIVLDDTCK